MTKLYEKLKELGYKPNKLIPFEYFKRYKKCTASILISGGLVGFLNLKYKISVINTQQDIDDLQQAFNELQKDIEELKKIWNLLKNK